MTEPAGPQPWLGDAPDTSKLEQNTPAKEPPKEIAEPSIVTTGTEPTGPRPQLAATPNAFIPYGIPKLDLHVDLAVTTPAQEKRKEIDSSAYLANPHDQGTGLNPVEDDIQRHTSEESSVIVTAEPAQPDNSSDHKAEIVANGIPLVAIMRTPTNSHAITTSQAVNNPSTDDYSRAAECAISPVDVSQAGQRDNECHMTEPGVELPLKSKSFHSDQLQSERESRIQLGTAPARASTDPQCSSPPPPSIPSNIPIDTDHSDSQEPDNERIN